MYFSVQNTKQLVLYKENTGRFLPEIRLFINYGYCSEYNVRKNVYEDIDIVFTIKNINMNAKKKTI